MLVRTRPFNPALDRAFDQLTSSFLTGARRSESHRSLARRTPAVDAAWHDGSLVLTVDLPGTPADAVGVGVAGRTLTVSVNAPDTSWERSVRLGAALDPEQVSANYVDGRLTVTVAPVASAEPRSIAISTEPAAPPAIDTGETTETGDQPEDATSDNA